MTNKERRNILRGTFDIQFKTLVGIAMDSGVSDYDIIELVRESIELWQEVHPEDDGEVD